MASCKNDFLCNLFFVIRILSFVNHRHNYTIYLKIMREEGMIKPCNYLRTYPGPRVFSSNFPSRRKERAAKRGGEREKPCFSFSPPLCSSLTLLQLKISRKTSGTRVLRPSLLNKFSSPISQECRVIFNNSWIKAQYDMKIYANLVRGFKRC